VTIFADETPEPVMIVPVQAVLGTISSGAERKCFVVGADGQPEKRDIVVGMSNERVVEIKSGLKEGDQVDLNPLPLLKEAAKDLKPGKERSRNEEEFSKGGKDGGKGGKGKSEKAPPKGPKDAMPSAPVGGKESRGGNPRQ